MLRPRAILAVLAGVGLVVAACYAPTQITVEVTTDLGCEKTPGTSITTGVPYAVEEASAVAVTGPCNGGSFGTLVIVPSDARDDRVVIKVVTSIGKPVEQCTPPYGKGCIVARRSLRFVEHTSLRLPIVMRASCEGLPCSEVETCVNGTCKSAEIDSSQCTGSGCAESDLFPDAPPPPDAGAPDADVDPEPPRLISPLSTSTVSIPRPTLRWEPAPNTDGVVIELCSDRPCTQVFAKVEATGKQVSHLDLATALPGSPVTTFWRARTRSGTRLGTKVSPTWQLVAATQPAVVINPTLSTSYGTMLDVNGDGMTDLAIGAWGNGTIGGKVYVYVAGKSTASPTTTLQLAAPSAVPGFGYKVTSAGDVNGDGYGDLIVVALANQTMPSAVFIFHGGPGGISTTPAVMLPGPAGNAFGTAIASAGDVNGDGYADVVVGAQYDRGGAGRAYVYLGSPNGITTASQTLEGPNGGSGEQFGGSVASGDFDGDGLADVVVGAPFTVAPLPGQLIVFRGVRGGPMVRANTLGAPGLLNLGVSVATGDMNGDGRSDVLAGAPRTNNTIGGYAIYFGSSGGLPTTPTFSSPFMAPASAQFGASVASADIDGDGYADAFIGGPTADGAKGQVAVLRMLPGGPMDTGTLLSPSMGPMPSMFGASISPIGDFDKDGAFDLLIGAPGLPSAAGTAYLYHWGMNGSVDVMNLITILDPGAGSPSNFGASVR